MNGMNDSNNCVNCRFGDHTNNCCKTCVTKKSTNPRTGKTEFSKPSKWLPLTEAQQLERILSNERSAGRLYGNFDTGYLYEPMKMYKNKSPRQKALEKIKKVIFNDPYTIVLWNDGTKTVVKCGKDDVFDPEKGLAMAISKYFFDNKGYFNDVFKKFIPEEKDEFHKLPTSLLEAIHKASHKVQNFANTLNTQKGLYSVKELAEQFECSESSILKDIKKGTFPGAKKEHGKWVIPYKF